MIAPPLLEVEELRTSFAARRGTMQHTVADVALDGVSFSIEAGQTLALVGESGCGNATTGRAILRLVPATGGRVHFEGQDVLSSDGRNMKTLRRRMQIVFPHTHSLDPRFTVEQTVAEALDAQGLVPASLRRERVLLLLERVGLSSQHFPLRPHQLSGGQRQRVGIARALAVEPAFIVCDEATSALDVSIQAQILDLLAQLQDELGLSYLFITHDLRLVRHLASHVAVMYLGRIVELAPTERLLSDPQHPYTKALLAAIPQASPRGRDHRRAQRRRLRGEPPNPQDRPCGCPFHPRCPDVMAMCRSGTPLHRTRRCRDTVRRAT